jgi:hypothetical protein
MNLNEQTNRIKQMMGILSEQTNPMTLEACKALVPKNSFEQAKQWWINWLDDKKTQIRFAVKNNLKKKDIKAFIDLYKKGLNDLKIDYTANPEMKEYFENKYAMAGYVNPGKIVINCDYFTDKNNISESDFKETFVHEIAHFLNSIQPLVSFYEIQKDFKIPNDIDSIEVMYPEEMRVKLKNDGLDDTLIKDIINRFYKMYLEDSSYIKEYSLNKDEILARLYNIRLLMNKKSGETITVNDINDLYKKIDTVDISDLVYVLFGIMLTNVSLSSILESLNSYTYKKQQNKNYNV